MKRCSKCNRSLPMNIEYFHKRSDSKDGFNSRCKECKGSKFGILQPNRVLDIPKGYKCCTKCREIKPNDSFAISESSCKECGKEYFREYHKRNRERRLELMSKYRDENKDSISQTKKNWYYQNREHVLERVKTYRISNRELVLLQKKNYRKNNKEKVKEQLRRCYLKNKDNYIQNSKLRRIKIKSLPSNFSIKDWDKCKNDFDNECAYCGKTKKLTQEHFIPVSKNGEYTINNILPACKSCNSSKQDVDFFEWYSKQDFYSKQREQRILKYLNYKNNIQQLALL